jgi:menaquinone-dependent protoporphyrinogen IX oxidase
MAEVLIVYSPSEEHVAVAAQQLRRSFERHGHEVHACRVDEAPTAPMGYDLVLVGVSVVPGHRNDELVRWVQGNVEQLARRDSGYFEVTLASTAGRAEESFVTELGARSGWTPARRWRCADYDDVERCGTAESALLDGQVRSSSA